MHARIAAEPMRWVLRTGCSDGIWGTPKGHGVGKECLRMQIFFFKPRDQHTNKVTVQNVPKNKKKEQDRKGKRQGGGGKGMQNGRRQQGLPHPHVRTRGPRRHHTPWQLLLQATCQLLESLIMFFKVSTSTHSTLVSRCHQDFLPSQWSSGCKAQGSCSHGPRVAERISWMSFRLSKIWTWE